MEKMVTISVRVPATVRRDLALLAGSDGRPADVIREALRAFLVAKRDVIRRRVAKAAAAVTRGD